MMVMSGLVGFLTSATGVYQSVIIGILVGKERFADGLGLSMPFAAVGTVAGPGFAGRRGAGDTVPGLRGLERSFTLLESTLCNYIKLKSTLKY